MPLQSEESLTTSVEGAEPCRWCGYIHAKLCPFVKALEYDIAGNVTRVEFITDADIKKAPVEEPRVEDYPRLGSKNAQE